jgi:hypothetical protein
MLRAMDGLTVCPECRRRGIILRSVGSPHSAVFKHGLIVNGKCDRCTYISTDAVVYQREVVRVLVGVLGYTDVGASELVSRYPKIVTQGILSNWGHGKTAGEIDASEEADLERMEEIRRSLGL